MEHEDTYFLSQEVASKVAAEQNRKNSGNWLQCCYFNGESPHIELPNLLPLPIDNLISGLASGLSRIPTNFSSEKSNLEASEINRLEKYFYTVEMALILVSHKLILFLVLF